MQLGMVGLGRMGASMVRRLLRNGHECIVFDVSPNAATELLKDGAWSSGKCWRNGSYLNWKANQSWNSRMTLLPTISFAAIEMREREGRNANE